MFLDYQEFIAEDQPNGIVDMKERAGEFQYFCDLKSCNFSSD